MCLMPAGEDAGEERHDDFKSNQNDDDPFQHFHAPSGSAGVKLLVEILDGIELAQDAGVPLAYVEALGRQAVHAGEELVAQQLRRITDALEEDGTFQLHPGNLPQGARLPARHPPLDTR